MENRLIALMLSWGGFLGFTAFSIAYMERFSYHAAIPWLLECFRVAFILIGALLLMRFLSFRAQKPWEKMVSAYSQTAGVEPTIRVAPPNESLNFVLYLGWIGAGISALAAGFPFLQEKTGWELVQILDITAWIFAWIWAAKVSWLRAARSREALKMSLDDLRSKRGQTSEPMREYKPGSPRARGWFAVLFLTGLGLMLGLAVWRLKGASGHAAKAALARCMDRSWRDATTAFEKQGKPPTWKTPDCAPDTARFRWNFHQEEGGITLSAWEGDQADPFGDGWYGNQGLRLVPEGRWVEIFRPKRHESGRAAP